MFRNIFIALVLLASIGGNVFLFQKVTGLRSTMESSADLNSDQKKELDALTGGIAEYKSQIEKLLAATNQLKDENSSYKSGLESMKSQIELQQKERDEIQKNIAKLEEARKNWEASIAAKEQVKAASEVNAVGQPSNVIQDNNNVPQGDDYINRLEAMRMNLEKSLMERDSRIDAVQKEIKMFSRSLEEADDSFSAILGEDVTPAPVTPVEVDKKEKSKAKESVVTKGDARKASAPAKESEKTGKPSADIHYNLGVTLYRQEKYKDAIKEFEAVLELVPNDADAHFNLAIIYDEKLNDDAKALDHYRQYIALNPNSPDRRNVEKWIMDEEAKLKVQ